ASTTVQSGEGINAVASRLNISPDELRNIIGDGTVLQPGQVITLGEGTQLVAINDNAIAQSNFAEMWDSSAFDPSLYTNFDPSQFAGLGIGGDYRLEAPDTTGATSDTGDGPLSTPSARGSTGGEFTEEAADNARSIEVSVENIAAHDLSLVIDPLI